MSEKKTYKEVMEQLKKDKIPRCPICFAKMVNATDSVTGKVSKYLWQTECGHSKNLRLSLG